MTQFAKMYIGKGKKNESYDIVTVSIDMEKAEPHIFEYKGKRYLRFEVATMKNPDEFNRTHTAYVSAKVEGQPENAEQNVEEINDVAAEPGDDLPF